MVPWILTQWTDFFPLLAAIVALGVAQAVKISYLFLSKKKLDMVQVFSAGGMPSSHSAMVASLSTAVGLREGWSSTPFCICVIFSFVVLYDAAGIRYAAGKHAARINRMTDDFYQKNDGSYERLTEFLGHSPLEVAVGTALGIGVAFLIY